MQPSNSSNSPNSAWSWLIKHNEFALALSLLMIILVFSLLSEHFFSVRNLTNVFGQASIILTLSLGVSLVFISGEVDISVGSLVAAVAIPLIEVMNVTESMTLGIFGALACGLLIGVINGYLVVYLRINSLIVTLGTLFIIRGGVYLYTGKKAIADKVYLESFFQLGNGRFMDVLPYPALIAGTLVILLTFALRHTRFGRKVYAIGGDAKVARLAGYNVQKVKFTCFVLCALISTVGGILLASRLGSAVHLAGLGYEFQAVAAAVLGGISLAGGIGSLVGVLLGVLILAFVSNGLGMLGAPTEWQLVVTGIVIIIAVTLDSMKKQ
ncbi:putative ABC-type branched-chain amino acid transport system, permease component [Vibrio nigripulchritudo SO65]|nr:ABC transporter permease [Vibrio nigripulchritudo]CCN35606.1 putative ABC-type branched-chain amino acid transport system, permease component [Vibrio nigripulchritudo AM115]CCN40809.1 putative ABC-type branched-chain amino acid transport system, permease component [Vibrio nigripulchritudo FTn2]CCN67321.1 putative ABC-type branched-chain amino acid transport system, permease component [Vibrio nigripulchritudo POn4]CCN74254.1 putative ABC-type branched-chain amino acid transport system, permea